MVVGRIKLNWCVQVPHKAPNVLVYDPEILLVLRDFGIPLLDFKADVLAEAAKKGLEESVAFDSELDKFIHLVSGVARDHEGD